MTTALNELGAADLGALYRRAELSPVEVARAVVAHVERCEPLLHATWAFDAERALAMAREVAAQQNVDGSLPAYLSPQWTRRAEWTCVTGNSQMAINWLRLARETGESTFVDNARRANRYNMSVQDLTHADPALRVL